MRGDKLLGGKFPAKTSLELSTQKLVKDSQKAFTSKQFSALVSIDGIDNAGKEFHLDFVFSNADPEFLAMINDYGARLSGKEIIETFLPIGKNLPPDGMMCTIKNRAGMEYTGYRFLDKWYNEIGCEWIGPDPVAYKPYNPKTQTAL